MPSRHEKERAATEHKHRCRSNDRVIDYFLTHLPSHLCRRVAPVASPLVHRRLVGQRLLQLRQVCEGGKSRRRRLLLLRAALPCLLLAIAALPLRRLLLSGLLPLSHWRCACRRRLCRRWRRGARRATTNAAWQEALEQLRKAGGRAPILLRLPRWLLRRWRLPLCCPLLRRRPFLLKLRVVRCCCDIQWCRQEVQLHLALHLLLALGVPHAPGCHGGPQPPIPRLGDALVGCSGNWRAWGAPAL